MTLGPGRYDDACTQARLATKAIGAILIIVEGKDGSGFSVQAPLPLVARLPSVLRDLADKIEKDIRPR